MNRARTTATALLLLTAISGCSSTPATAPVADTSATTITAPSRPAAAAASPSTSECTAFAQAYNAGVTPILNATGGTDYMAQLTDAFTTLAATVASSPDPDSQTIHADALAIAADPSSYTAMGQFQTDLTTFLGACGITSGS